MPYTNFNDAKTEAEAKNLEIAADNGHGEGLKRRQAIASHTIREAVREGHFFVPREMASNSGKSKYSDTRAGCYSKDTFSRILRKAICNAKESGVDLPPGFVPKKLRHSFATNLHSMDADFSDLQAYMGHCPSSVLAGHYLVASEKRLGKIAGLAQGILGHC